MDLSLSALRNWILWDLEAACHDIEQCAFKAFELNSYVDSIALDIASFVAVQLVGLLIFPEHVPWGENGKIGERVTRSISIAELLMKFSRMSLWPWGRFLDEFNLTILEHFVGNNSHKAKRSE